MIYGDLKQQEKNSSYIYINPIQDFGVLLDLGGYITFSPGGGGSLICRDQGVFQAYSDIFLSLLCKPVGRGSGGLASHTRTFPDLVTPRAFSLHLANEILGSFGPKETPLCSYRKFWLKRQTVLDFEQEINCKFPSIY